MKRLKTALMIGTLALPLTVASLARAQSTPATPASTSSQTTKTTKKAKVAKKAHKKHFWNRKKSGKKSSTASATK